MTATEKVLQRKDGSTLIVGAVLAFITLQFVMAVTTPFATKLISSLDGTPPLTFKEQFLLPFVSLILQLIAVELLVWVVIGLRALVYTTPAKKRRK